MIRSGVALLALVAILLAVNVSIRDKERHLANGRVVLLELAPIDPRSLMQGDYMALAFDVANKLRSELPELEGARRWWRKVDATDGWVVLDLDDQGIGRYAGVAQTAHNPADRQINVAFRVRSGTVKFATNAYFFEEGTAAEYEEARYGEFRINANGEPLLVSLLDENLNRLGPTP